MDGGDVYVTTDESVAVLVAASSKMGEDVLSDILARLPEKQCGSLLSYSTSLSDGVLVPKPWDWQFLVGRMRIQELGAGLRVKPEHSLDDVAAILNEHGDLVFTSPNRMRTAFEQARQEKFDSLEHLLADMLIAQALSVTGLVLAVKQPEFGGLRYQSTAAYLAMLEPELGSENDLMQIAQADRPRAPVTNKPRSAGYVYVMLDRETSGFLKIGQTMNHPEVRLHQLNKETSRVYPLVLIDSWQCDNPAAVERELHAALARYRVTQSREFFATDIETVRQAVRRILT